MLAHTVYFILNDDSEQAKQSLIDDAHHYLKNLPELKHFSIGTLAGEFQRDANDRDFDVALHLLFEDKQGHDTYQTSEAHVTFIGKNKENWKRIRVFDSYVTT